MERRKRSQKLEIFSERKPSTTSGGTITVAKCFQGQKMKPFTCIPFVSSDLSSPLLPRQWSVSHSPFDCTNISSSFFFFFFSRASNKVKTIFVFSFCRERKAREKEKWFSSEKLFKNDGRVRFKQFAPPKAGFPKKDCCTVGKLLSFQFQFDATFGDSSTGSRISRKTTLDFLVNRFFFSPHEWIQIFPAFITTYATVIFSSFFFHF